MKYIVFVCMGNICRSPLAEAEAKRAFEVAGFGGDLNVVSVGTIGHHHGYPADPRSVALGRTVGLDLSNHRAHALNDDHLQNADLLIAMDRRNLADLRARAPVHASGRIRLLMEFAERPRVDVPDPYCGTQQDFELCYALIREGVAGLTKHLARLHNAGQLVTE